MNKNDLRQYVRIQKRLFTDSQLKSMSEPIIRKLMASPQMKAAKTILMYYSLADEVNTHEIINELVAQGKTVLLPAVTGDTSMELRLYKGADDLRGGFFNIMEPVGSVFSDFSSIDVAVVPGMAFDLLGHRLGRGKGYYDRLLPQLPHVYKIGVCFAFQKLPGIPTDDTDVTMDEVISER